MLKLGILTCIHGNAKAAKALAKKYEKEKVDAIVLLGDLGDNFKEISSVLNAVKKCKTRILVSPGSH